VRCLCAAAVTPSLAGQAALWLRLVSDVIRGSPEQGALAAVWLPLAINIPDEPAGSSVTQHALADDAVDAALLEVWQLVAAWMAHPDVKGESLVLCCDVCAWKRLASVVTSRCQQLSWRSIDDTVLQLFIEECCLKRCPSCMSFLKFSQALTLRAMQTRSAVPACDLCRVG